MSLGVGARLGHYAVTTKIGEGGMGEVWQATDTKLNRQVALKILPEAFAADPDRLARFQREAQVLASLNHPGIAAIYGIEESEGTRALVLELVEGPTLADRIKQGPIAVDEALPIAKQIAEALEAAHEAGVIHRDLKPANIKVRDDGTVKVLDFGLAKALDTTPQGDPSLSPTLTAAATQMGVIMGTAAYMSPEQARGNTVDKRSDVWAFGAVLFEMLTGKRLFVGATVSDTLATVLRAQLDWSVLPDDTPVPVQRLLRRCLERDRYERLQHLGDARIEVNEAIDGEPGLSPRTPRYGPFPWVFGGAGVGALLTGIAAWLLLPVGTDDPTGVTHMTVPVVGGHAMLWGQCPRLTVSPDGRTLAYVAQGRLFIRAFGRAESVEISGTEGAESPFFSHDGQSIAFVQNSALRRVSVEGGAITEIEGANPGWECIEASWGEDDRIVFRPAGSRVLWRVPVAGGVAQRVTALSGDELKSFHVWPQVIDGGRQLLYTVIGPSTLWEDAKIVTQDLETGHRTTIVDKGTYGRYLPTGHVVYATANGNILAVPYELSRREVTGEAVAVEDGVRVAVWGGAASFAVSNTGTAVFVKGSTWTRQTLWLLDRQGQRLRQLGSPLSTWYVNLSPNGQQLALDIHKSTNSDVHLINVATEQSDRFTIDPGIDYSPVSSPDGHRLAYVAYSAEGLSIILDDIGDRGQTVTLYTAPSDSDLWVFSWSPNGDWLAFVEGEGGNLNIHALKVDDPGTRIQVSATEESEFFPQFSPDGQWLAYDSTVGSTSQVFVVSFPDVGRPQQVSIDGGDSPRWSLAGGELFFWNGKTLMVAPVTTGDSFTRETPQRLFDVEEIADTEQYSVTPDGQQFVVSVNNAAGLSTEIHVILDWFEELKRLVPTE